MLYKTITLRLLEANPTLYETLRQNRALLQTQIRRREGEWARCASEEEMREVGRG